MPHRVASFFRSPNESINNIKATVQRRRSPSSRSPASTPASTPRPREGISRAISYNSSTDEEPAEDHTHHGFHSSLWGAPQISLKMPESAKEKEAAHHHRLSFPGLHIGGHKSSKEHGQHPHASLDWKIESPPAVMHGDAENSTGALVSGQLLLNVKEEPFEVDTFEAKLDIHVIQKRPFHQHCHDCTNQKTELKNWKFFGDTMLSKGLHEVPFSVLLEGHLPASTDNAVIAVKYEFTAEVKPKQGPVLKMAKTINVKRSLPVPELPHHSVRIFPPTNIAASVHYPQVIHPIGSNTLQLRLDGIVKTNSDANTVEYWKLKRLSWKLEEHLNTVAPACTKHMPKDAEAAAKKGLKRTEARTIGSADLTNGWKSDYSPNGNVEMELEYQCNVNSKSACDMKSRDGTEVTHQLVVEMVVVQEYAPINQPKNITPTGVARILRMHFGTTLTERAGLGVSWDNEAPPIYQDVPPSPPSYNCDIPYESIDCLSDIDLASSDKADGSARSESSAS